MEFIQDLGLFASKLIIVALCIGLLAGLIAVVIHKSQKLKSHFEFENLNEHYEDIEWALKQSVLSEKSLKEELKKLKEKDKKKKDDPQWDNQKRVFVLNFEGDIKAHASEHLREEINTVLSIARPKDEVVLKLESSGGMVHAYGFCASQLSRLKAAQIPLTVCVDRVAASGGYMMACVATKVLAAPFAIVGSIGVLAQVPNLHKLLKKHDVDYKEYTSGEYKRTVSFLGEITSAGEKKFTEQLNDTHILFKNFVKENRPVVDLDKVATGEYWYGLQAKELNLVDELTTSDDYLMKQKDSALITKITYKIKKSLSEKLSDALGRASSKVVERIMQNLQDTRW
jgi:serine protease SohB